MSHRNSRSGRVPARPGQVFCLAVLMLAFAAPLWAQLGQGRMQGRVTDTHGNNLEGVSVVAHNPNIQPPTLSATSNENGRWAILGFPGGTQWKFVFTKEGYGQFEITAPVAGLSKNPDMDVALEAVAMTADGAMVSEGTNLEAFQEGNQLYDEEDFAGALAKWDEFLASNPDVYQVNVNRGNALRALDRVDEARAAYQVVLESDPAETRALYNLGEIEIAADNIAGALPYFEKVIENSPEDPAVYYNVAEIYFDRREVEAAIDYYQQALEVDPEYLPAMRQMGYAYINKGDFPAAIASFENYLNTSPEGSQEAAVVRDIVAALKESQYD